MRIAVLPDTHHPFCDSDKLIKASKIVKEFRPQAIIQVGDLYDQFSFSKYPRDLSAIRMNPAEEAQAGRAHAERMWSMFQHVAPNADLFQLAGNHDVRVVKRMLENAPEAAFIGQSWLEHQMDFSDFGVETVEDEFILDDIMFMHGMRKAGEHAKFNQMNTVTGHTHKARIEYFANRFGSYWEMNCGWLGDIESPVFSYRAQKKINDTNTGIGLIEDGNPRFVMI